MKKKFLLILLFIIFTILIGAVAYFYSLGAYKKNEIVIPEMQVGENITLSYSVQEDESIYWYSQNSLIAKVENGKVYAVHEGETSIVLYVNGIADTYYKIKVVARKPSSDPTNSSKQESNPNDDKSIILIPNQYEMTVGEQVALLVKSNSDNTVFTWESSDSTIASVQNGIVTANKIGNVTITVTTPDGLKASSSIHVVKSRVGFINLFQTPEKKVSIKSISIVPSSKTIFIGEETSFEAIISPTNASNQSITWSSSNTSIATVIDGKVTGVSNGTCYITALADEKSASAQVTVQSIEPITENIDVTSVSITDGNQNLKVGSTKQLSVSISPTNATNKNLTWKSSNTSVATVSNGLVKAKNAGTTTITVSSHNKKTASITVTVTKKEISITSISLNPSNKQMDSGDTLTLTVTLKPQNATNTNITWSSSNTSVAKVSNGIVTAISAGSATITAKTSNGKTATCKVTVSNRIINVTSVTVSPTTLTLSPGNSSTIQAFVTPSNSTNQAITWSSSNTSIATVSNGVVTAISAGTATITAKSSNGKTATCTVVVQNTNKIHYISNGRAFAVPSNGGTGVSPANTIVLESNGHFALIDTGTTNGYSANPGHSTLVVEYLRKIGASKLDFIIITHDHYDHLGGLAEIIDSIPVDIVYIKPYYSHDRDGSGDENTRIRYATILTKYFGSSFSCDTNCLKNPDAYRNALKAVDSLYGTTRNNVGALQTSSVLYKINANSEGKLLILGSMSINIYNTTNLSYHSACYGTSGSEFDENANSIVSYIQMGNRKALLAGDLEPISQKCYNGVYGSCSSSKCSIMNFVLLKINNGRQLNVDLLELSHHGYSSCDMSDSARSIINPSTLVIPNWYEKIYYYYTTGPYSNASSCKYKYFNTQYFDSHTYYVGTNNIVFDFTNNNYNIYYN